MMPASVGVNWPVRMPPMMMIGIISGTAASFVAVRELAERGALALDADRPEEMAVDHQPDADQQTPGTTPPRNSPPIETLPVAP